jgi:hypothetical protein
LPPTSSPKAVTHVAPEAAAFQQGIDQGGEVVVGENDVGGLPGHLGAALAHGHAHVGQPQRGSVVDAVAGHGHRMARRAQFFNNAELIERGGPGNHGHALEPLPQFLRVEVHQLRGSHDLGELPVEQAGLPADGLPGGRVVAGQHHDPDAGALAAFHCFADPGPERVVDAQKAQGRQSLGVFERRAGRSLGHQEDAQATASQSGGPIEERLTPLLIEGLIAAIPAEARAAGEEALGRSLQADTVGEPAGVEGSDGIKG